MQTPDDAQFEAYLKQFHPLPPPEPPIERSGRTLPRRWVLLVGTAAAALLIAAPLLFRTPRRFHAPQKIESAAGAEQLVNDRPLTIRRANALLSTAPSFRAAFDQIALPPRAIPLPSDKHSALAALAKEKTNL